MYARTQLFSDHTEIYNVEVNSARMSRCCMLLQADSLLSVAIRYLNALVQLTAVLYCI